MDTPSEPPDQEAQGAGGPNARPPLPTGETTQAGAATSSPVKKGRIPAAQQAAIALQREQEGKVQRGLQLWRTAQAELASTELDTAQAMGIGELTLKNKNASLYTVQHSVRKIQKQITIHRNILLQFQEAVAATGFAMPSHIQDLEHQVSQGQQLVLRLAQKEAALTVAEEDTSEDANNRANTRDLGEESNVEEGEITVRRMNSNERVSQRQEVAAGPAQHNRGGGASAVVIPDWLSGVNGTQLGSRLLGDSQVRGSLGGCQPGPRDFGSTGVFTRGNHSDTPDEQERMLQYHRDEPSAFYMSLPPPWNVVPGRPVRAQEAHKLARSVEDFDGTPLQYTVWRAGYISMVHRCATEIDQKLRLLFKSFTPEARLDPRVAGLRRMPPTADTYATVVETLELEYGGDRRLLATTLKAMKELAPVRVGDTAAMRAYLMHVSAYLQHCQLAGQPLNKGDVNLFHTFCSFLAPYAAEQYRVFVIRERLDYNVQSLLAWVRAQIQAHRDRDLFFDAPTAQGKNIKNAPPRKAFQADIQESQRRELTVSTDSGASQDSLELTAAFCLCL